MDTTNLEFSYPERNNTWGHITYHLNGRQIRDGMRVEVLWPDGSTTRCVLLKSGTSKVHVERYDVESPTYGVRYSYRGLNGWADCMGLLMRGVRDDA